MIASMLAIGPAVLSAPTGPQGRANVNEVETNDNWTLAQALNPGDILSGNTGMLSGHPIDYYKIKPVAGKVMTIAVQSNSTGYNDKVFHLDLYDKWVRTDPKVLPVAWSHSGFPWEAVTCLAKYDDFYYIGITPWKGALMSYKIWVDTITPTPVNANDQLGDTVSNNTNKPAVWYTMQLTGGQTSNDVANATLSVANPSISIKADLYIRDLMPNSWTWWYNYSWWGAFFGKTTHFEEAEAAASYTGTYYINVQAWNATSIPYQISFLKKTQPSDGDNTIDTATLVKRQPGQTQAKFTSTIDMAYDHFDFYKIHLKKGQGITATMLMQDPWSQAIYRCSILYKNTTTNFWESWSSWTNIKDPSIVTGQAQAFLNPAPAEADYYIQVMAQVPLHPSNHSNLADWHLNNAHAKYQLIVDLPMDELHAPYLKQPPVTTISIPGDQTNSDLKLSNVFGDVDIGDAVLQDAIKFSTNGSVDHLKINISNDATGMVTITPEKYFQGQVGVWFKATDLYGLTCTTKIQVVVQQVPHSPIIGPGMVEVLHDFNVKEGTTNGTNNNMVLVDKNTNPWTYKGFWDPDLAYGDVLNYTVVSNGTANAYVPTTIITANNYITVRYENAKIYHPTGDTSTYKVPITIKATDSTTPTGLWVTYTYNVTIEQNPPDINCADTVVTMYEHGNQTQNLNDVCKASTGHKLTFEFISGNSQNLTVKVDPPSGMVKFSALGYYFNTNGENLNFKAYMTQPWQKTVYFTLNVVILNVNAPPEIRNPQPDPQIAINIPEWSTKDFSVSIFDRDTPLLDMRYTWYVDNIAVASGTSSFRWQPDYSQAEVNQGSHVVTIKVNDGATPNGIAYFNWTVHVDDTNRKPTAKISNPQNNTQFDSGKAIFFVCVANDPDNDPITLIWYENGAEIHRTQSGNPPDKNGTIDNWNKKFAAGTTHVIELVVKDSGGMENDYYTTIVIKPAPAKTGIIPGFETVFLIVAVVGVAAAVSYRRKE
jgi:hypothetical protein